MSREGRDYDLLLASASTVGLVLVVAALLADHGARASAHAASHRPVLGEVDFVEQDTRQREPDRLVWRTLRAGQPVRGGDAVFVGAESSARLRMRDGAHMTLGANTLLVLHADAPARGREAELRVRLRRGLVSGRAGARALRVESAGARATLSPQAATVMTADEDETRVTVLSGRAEVQSRAGTKTLAARQSARADHAGVWGPTKRFGATLSGPAAASRHYFTDAPEPVPLSWDGDLAGGVRVQVARDRRFTGAVIAVEVSGRAHDFTPGEAGVYWWRLVDASGRPVSASRSFSAREVVAPRPTHPAPDELVLAPGGLDLALMWEQIPGAAGYEVQLARDPRFAEPLADLRVDAAQVALARPLPEGHYLWRVRAIGPWGFEAPFSEAARFRLIHAPVPDAPRALETEYMTEPHE